jgi:glycosyltransferase involved in cell wall biosynthesis
MSIKTINSQLPKVTICVPVRNGARTIQRTLDSLLNQDYPNYEIIVSDNCSDDDTAKIVSQYASNGVKYFFNPVLDKWGAESNWNHILTLAEGPFIALYHADDIYTPTMVRRQVEFLLKYPEASAVFAMTQTIDEYDRPIKRGRIKLPQELKGKEIFHYAEFLNYTLKYSTFVIVPTMMSKRETIDRVGVFNWEKYATASDIDLYLRMAKIGSIGVIDEPLHKYRISDQQSTAQIFYQRTFLAHFCNVMDDYISMPDSVELIQKNSLSMYRMRRAADQIRCAINMLAQGKVAEAKINLIHALKYAYIMEAFKGTFLKRPQEFALFSVGFILLASSYLGVGTFSGQQIYKLFQKYSKSQREPSG